MPHQSTILFSGLAGLATLLVSLPATAISASNTGGLINANSSANFNFDINNPGSAVSVSNVTLSIESLAATDLADIELYLRSPNNTYTLTLKNALSNPGSTNYNNVTFTDAAGAGIDTVTDPTITGSFQPQGGTGTSLTANIFSFAEFNSVILDPGVNTWTLTVYNFDLSNSASISNITLNATPVPLESDALPILFSVGFLGGGVWIKRRLKSAKKRTF